MRSFLEVVMGNFQFDPELAVWRFRFGEGENYSLELEPLTYGQYHLALYEKWPPGSTGPYLLKWQDKLPIRPGYSFPEGPGEGDDQPPARRAALRRWLVSLLAEIDKADQEAEG